MSRRRGRGSLGPCTGEHDLEPRERVAQARGGVRSRRRRTRPSSVGVADRPKFLTPGRQFHDVDDNKRYAAGASVDRGQLPALVWDRSGLRWDQRLRRTVTLTCRCRASASPLETRDSAGLRHVTKGRVSGGGRRRCCSTSTMMRSMWRLPSGSCTCLSRSRHLMMSPAEKLSRLDSTSCRSSGRACRPRTGSARH